MQRSTKKGYTFLVRKWEGNKIAKAKESAFLKLSEPERIIQSNLEHVLLENDELIRYTKTVFGFCPEWDDSVNFKTLFIGVIENYTRYCLTLPASEGYHHSVSYGLINHSLQVGNLSLRKAKSLFLPHKFPLDVERLRKKRYHYAAWLCGLLHDAGKLHTDILVTAKENSELIWYPTDESLASWMIKNNVTEYTIKWRRDRLHKKHETASLHFFQQVLTPEARKYLNTCPDDLFMEISDVLGAHHRKMQYLHTSLRVADAVSTANDIQVVWDEKLGARKAAFHEKIIKTLRSLSSDWFENGKAFAIDDEIYLRWPECFGEAAEKLHEIDKTIPNNSSAVRKALADRGVIRDISDNEYALFFKGEHTSKEAYEFLLSNETKQGVGLLRVEWPSHVIGSQPMPENTFGLLKLDIEGNSINYTNNPPEHISVKLQGEYLAEKELAKKNALKLTAKEQGDKPHNEPVQAGDVNNTPESSAGAKAAKEQGDKPHNEPVQAGDVNNTPESSAGAKAAKEQGDKPHNEPVQAGDVNNTPESSAGAKAAKEQGDKPHNEPVQAGDVNNTPESSAGAKAAKEQGDKPHNEPVQSSGKAKKNSDSKPKATKKTSKAKSKLKKPVNKNADLFKPSIVVDTKHVNQELEAENQSSTLNEESPKWHQFEYATSEDINVITEVLKNGNIYFNENDYFIEVNEVYAKLEGNLLEDRLFNSKHLIAKSRLMPHLKYFYVKGVPFIKFGQVLAEYLNSKPHTKNIILKGYENSFIDNENDAKNQHDLEPIEPLTPPADTKKNEDSAKNPPSTLEIARNGIITELRKLDVLNDEIEVATNTLNTHFKSEYYTFNEDDILIIDSSKVYKGFYGVINDKLVEKLLLASANYNKGQK